MIFEKIKKIIADQIGADENEVTMETSFSDLEMDSLDLFQIIIEIEEQFDIQIEDAESIKTVGEAVKYVETNTKQ
jgi:acyl carrier protein